MEVMEIIKDAFTFPSKNIKILLIYVVLAVLAGIFSFVGTIVYIFGFVSAECFLWGGLAFIVSMLIGWVLSGYLISVIKSGIELDDEVPEFEWWDNFITGFNNFIVAIVYYVIPAFIVFVVGYITNVFGNLWLVYQEIFLQAQNLYTGAASTFVVSDALSHAMVNLAVSLSITLAVAVIVFVIFLFIQTMAEARLANTGSLKTALNIYGSAKDISRIGVGKVILLSILIFVIYSIIETILAIICNQFLVLSILSIIITPYIGLFGQRALGLLYSDIV